MSEIQKKYSRRTVALFWCLLAGIAIGILIYFKQIALLYVLATLSIVVLLLIVGSADLEHIGRDNDAGFAPKSE
jgi:membrane protein YdbS with pleckstrin-like domain